ncbi:MAG: sigma-70 family RNA polymerase sigma factor [Lentisphaeria bacterium]|nr:sigma-70 family RNA polymerase sigma factor [Lentisphaeria bacterium]
MMITVNDTSGDTELISAYLRGDDKAFEILYFRYKRQFYGYLNNLLRGSAIDPDDVFEETWLKVIDKLPKYKEQGRFSAWLFRLGHNIFIDKIRKNGNVALQSIDREDMPELPEPEHRQPAGEMENAELGKEIEKAVHALSAEQREVFLLRQQELSFKEIADIQNCPVNTVLSRMHYAIKNLRIFLAESRALVK